jgi:transcriptional regulator with PAS, ATPase and Fis domain
MATCFAENPRTSFEYFAETADFDFNLDLTGEAEDWSENDDDSKTTTETRRSSSRHTARHESPLSRNRRSDPLPGFEGMIGGSAAIQAVFEKIKLAASANCTVLILGESGTGKELVAQALHNLSPRRSRPFLPVNCAALPDQLIESELFGHEKGAFTGAAARRDGLFTAADSGTLFIDEIGEMRLDLQSKLLRVIESKRVMPVGSNREKAVDVRTIFATNRELEKVVGDGEFREDLYYRIRVVEIRLPPLRERREDIPCLVHAFLNQISDENHRGGVEISDRALEVLMRYDWPGNVRELRNLLEGIVVLSTNDMIDVADLPGRVRQESAESTTLPRLSGMSMADIERQAICQTLEETNGCRTQAGKILGISVRTLQRKIKQYDLPF